MEDAAEIGREHDQIGLFHLSNFSNWKRVDLDGVMRYIPVNSDDADIDYLADLSPAMFTLMDSIAKRRGDQPVIFVAGSDIDEETIPKIHAEICTCIVNKTSLPLVMFTLIAPLIKQVQRSRRRSDCRRSPQVQA